MMAPRTIVFCKLRPGAGISRGSCPVNTIDKESQRRFRGSDLSGCPGTSGFSLRLLRVQVRLLPVPRQIREVGGEFKIQARVAGRQQVVIDIS
jgi:hypothetical protein